MENTSTSQFGSMLVSTLLLLTPLVKAFAQWHVSLRKISNKTMPASTRQDQTSTQSQIDGRSWYRRLGVLGWMGIVMVVGRTLMVFAGLSMFSSLVVSNEPLTTGRAACIALAAASIIAGLCGNSKEGAG